MKTKEELAEVYAVKIRAFCDCGKEIQPQISGVFAVPYRHVCDCGKDHYLDQIFPHYDIRCGDKEE